MKKQLFIRGDLNVLQGNSIPLNNQVWIEILKREYGTIKNDMSIWLYENTKNNGINDPTIFPGSIKVINNNEYEILIDENKMEYLSESNLFKDYSAGDVINEKYFQQIYQELGYK